MGFHVLEPHARGLHKGPEGPRLVDDVILELLGGHPHLPPAEAQEVREAGMRAHRHPVLLRQRHRPAHHVGVPRVEAAAHVRARDVGHHLLVPAHLEDAEALAHVAVDVDDGRHRRTLARVSLK